MQIKLNNTEYPVLKEGNGSVDCLTVGLGVLLQRSLSSEFKKLFTVYATDSYFIEDFKHPNPKTVTMQTLVDDIIAMIDQLKLNKPILIPHSCFGMVAMEVAKQAGDKIGGIILVASAPQWNAESIAFTNQYFMDHAEPERIANDKMRKEHYARVRKPTDSEVSIGKYISDTARYWGNYHINEDEIYALWDGIHINDDMINQFFEVILPQYDLKQHIERVTVPVILLAGTQDYDSLPLIQWKDYPKPPKFTIINCGDVGHWPQLESTALFDNAIQEWLES
jgi:pimeloyl-ACP methyl ester carboxylesterase